MRMFYRVQFITFRVVCCIDTNFISMTCVHQRLEQIPSHAAVGINILASCYLLFFGFLYCMRGVLDLIISTSVENISFPCDNDRDRPCGKGLHNWIQFFPRFLSLSNQSFLFNVFFFLLSPHLRVEALMVYNFQSYPVSVFIGTFHKHNTRIPHTNLKKLC